MFEVNWRAVKWQALGVFIWFIAISIACVAGVWITNEIIRDNYWPLVIVLPIAFVAACFAGNVTRKRKPPTGPA